MPKLLAALIILLQIPKFAEHSNVFFAFDFSVLYPGKAPDLAAVVWYLLWHAIDLPAAQGCKFILSFTAPCPRCFRLMTASMTLLLDARWLRKGNGEMFYEQQS